MILVTGAGGFIASHLVEHLVGEGATVRALVSYNSAGRWGWLDSADSSVRAAIDVVAGDIRDAQSVRAAASGCEAILHLAALISIPYSYASPESFIETNVRGTLNVLQAARDTGASRVVLTSTSEVYGTARTVPMTEEHPLSAQSPYAASKTAADQLGLSFHKSYGTPVTIVRPFNTYGPRQSARAILSSIISQIAGGARRVRVGSLHPTRDFTFVADSVLGFAAALGAPDAIGEIVNLGSGFEVTIEDAAQLIGEVMGVDITLEVEAMRIRPARSEVDRLLADNAKAERILGWRPRYQGRDGFRSGIEQTVKWFRDSGNLRHYRAGRCDV